MPGLTKRNHGCAQFAEHVDIAPTITTLCGLPPMETVDGKDISNLLRGGDTPVRSVAVTENPWSRSLWWGKWRFVFYPQEKSGADVGELYEMDADPTRHSISTTIPDTLRS